VCIHMLQYTAGASAAAAAHDDDDVDEHARPAGCGVLAEETPGLFSFLSLPLE
jgi:hypothetical protein